MATNHEVLVVKAVAQMKGVTTQAVYEAIRDGRLKARKLHGTWLIDRRDAEAWEVRRRPPP